MWSTVSLKLAWEMRIGHRNLTWTFRKMWCWHSCLWGGRSLERLVPVTQNIQLIFVVKHLVPSFLCMKYKVLSIPFPYTSYEVPENELCRIYYFACRIFLYIFLDGFCLVYSWSNNLLASSALQYCQMCCKLRIWLWSIILPHKVNACL